jgi:large subunit ribosomal protein L21
MYGVVEIQGHQYKVQPGDFIDVEKLNEEAGKTVEFDSVLFTSGDTPCVGLPTVKGAKVTAKVVKQDRSRKLIVFKRKPHHRTVKAGHRQNFTGLLITEITDGNGNTVKIDADSAVAKKHL